MQSDKDKKDKSSSDLANPDRRQFILTSGSTVAAGVIAACTPAYTTDTAELSESPAVSPEKFQIEGAVPIVLRINGNEHQLRVDPRTTLLDCLRENVVLTGTKKGCD